MGNFATMPRQRTKTKVFGALGFWLKMLKRRFSHALLQLMAGMAVVCISAPLHGASAPSENNGLKLGPGRLHPKVQADVHYLMNPGRMPKNKPNDMALVIRPGLQLEFPWELLQLNIDTGIEWWQFLGIDNSKTKDLSGLYGTLDINGVVNKDGAVTFKFFEKLYRSAEPGNQTITQRLDRTRNEIGVAADVRPGGGALVLSPAYELSIENYDKGDSAIANSSALNNMRHRPRFRALWKFLPKTAVFFEADSMITRYQKTQNNSDVNLLFVQAGASGAVTQKISMLLRAGYGNTFMKKQDEKEGEKDFSSLVGQAQVEFLANDSIKVQTGVLRSVQPTSLFKYVSVLQGYVGYSQDIGDRIQAGGKLAYGYMTFGRPPEGPKKRRKDHSIRGTASVSYKMSDWLSLSIGNSLDVRESNFKTSGSTRAKYVYDDFYVRVDGHY